MYECMHVMAFIICLRHLCPILCGDGCSLHLLRFLVFFVCYLMDPTNIKSSASWFSLSLSIFLQIYVTVLNFNFKKDHLKIYVLNVESRDYF